MNIMTKYAGLWMAMGNPDPRCDLALMQKLTRLKLISVAVLVLGVVCIYYAHSWLPKGFHLITNLIALGLTLALIVLFKKVLHCQGQFNDQVASERFYAIIQIIGKIAGKSLGSEQISEFNWREIHDSVTLAVEAHIRKLAKANPKQFDELFCKDYRDIVGMLLMSPDAIDYKDFSGQFPS